MSLWRSTVQAWMDMCKQRVEGKLFNLLTFMFLLSLNISRTIWDVAFTPPAFILIVLSVVKL